MSKDKDAFKRAMAELHEAELDADQREALAVVERYSGELRRQAAELKAEVPRLQGSLAAAEEKIVGLQKVAQENAGLEERLRASGERVEMLEAQATKLRQKLPDLIPKATEVLQAASMLTTNATRMFDYTLEGWDRTKTTEIAFYFALLMMNRACQFMANRNEKDTDLEKDLAAACQKYFERVAPGQFTWTM